MQSNPLVDLSASEIRIPWSTGLYLMEKQLEGAHWVSGTVEERGAYTYIRYSLAFAAAVLGHTSQ